MKKDALKIYISGAVTHDEHYKQKFSYYEKRLKAMGHDVVNPLRLTKHLKLKKKATDEDKKIFWQECLKADIKAMSDCDYVADIDVFHEEKIKSDGRDFEKYVAEKIGIPVKKVSYFL